MADFTALKAEIQNYVKQNGNNAITGEGLQAILISMVQALGDSAINDLASNLSDEALARQGADTTLQGNIDAANTAITTLATFIGNGYMFRGIATLETVPSALGGKVFYITATAGQYTNMGGITVSEGVSILSYDGTSWSASLLIGIDATPTNGSNGLVRSGGVYTSLTQENARAIAAETASAVFDSTTKKLIFKNAAGTVLYEMDATPFVIDGMVDNVYISGGNLIISFNTDAGKQDISIPLTAIFNPANYYDKTAVDALLLPITTRLSAGYLYMGKATPSGTPDTSVGKVFYLTATAGTYTNYGNLTVNAGITILSYNGSVWSADLLVAIDSTPTQNSNALVTSGGVFAAIKTVSDMLAEGYLYKGIATAATDPSTPAAKVFYIAIAAGTYTNFVDSGSQPLVLKQGINILKYNGTAWSVEQVIGVDDEPIPNSNGLVKSDGVAKITSHFRSSMNVCSGTVEYYGKVVARDGSIVDNAIYVTSVMFPIKGGTIYSQNNIILIAYYDDSKQFISRPDVVTVNITTPSNAAYARVASYYSPSTWQLNEGDTLLEYERTGLNEVDVNVHTDVTFTRSGVSADSYAVGKTREVKVLKIIAISDIVSRLSAGEYGFHLGAKKIIFKTDDFFRTYEEITPSTDELYIHDGIVYQWNGSNLIPIDEDITCRYELFSESKTISTTGETLTILRAGKSYVFTNNGINEVAIYARVISGGENITISSLLHSGETIEYEASSTTYYIVVGSSNDSVDVSIYEKGGYHDVANNNAESLIDTLDVSHPSNKLLVGETYKFRNTGDDVRVVLKHDGTIIKDVSVLYAGEEFIYTPNVLIDGIVLGQAEGHTRSVELYNIKSIAAAVDAVDNSALHDSIVDFDLKEPIEDVSSEFGEFDWSDTIYQTDLMEQLYANFDKLCALYPSYITKYDPMATAEISQTVTIDGAAHTIVIHGMSSVKADMATRGFNDYPEYANGIQSPIQRTLPKGDGTTYDVTYDVTPAYKTYVYILSGDDSVLYAGSTKKKVLITGGVHANERWSPFNLYILAKRLCECGNTNAFKMRASADFCIIPFVNGYGCYHTRRGNANWVDINRNYPTGLWRFIDTGLDERDIWTCIYSGPSAGSEFETNLVMSVIDWYNAEICIDHHNYAYSYNQFYNEYNNLQLKPLIMMAAIDVSRELQVKYPSFYGTSYKLYLSEDSVRINRNSSTGYYMQLHTKNGLGLTVEVSQCINYNGGVHDPNGSPVEAFTANVANIGYYTLKHQLMIFLDYMYKRNGIIPVLL